MEKAFVDTGGSLAERLMAALIAGDWAGGQRTGRESATLLVKTPEGWPNDIDLRVDHSSDPVGELKELFYMQMAREQVIRADILARRGQFEQSKAILLQAVARGSSWSRVWLRGARVAIEIEEPTLALQYLSVAFSQNPAWIKAEIGDGDFADLGANPQFHRWISPEEEQKVLADYKRMRQAQETPIKRRIEASRTLLEIGRADEALNILDTTAKSAAETTDLGLLRSAAYAAKGDYSKAIEQCKSILDKTPNQERVRWRIARFEEEARLR
jgi:tetratricopeptide (TPR) repeat protein